MAHSIDDAGTTHPADQDLVELLRRQDGRETLVDLHDGLRLAVFNIAWGYDIGDDHAHVTTNISPSVAGQPADFFFTYDVVRVIDAVSGAVLWEGWA